MVSGNTIYEEVRLAKADIIAMEQQIRTIETELKHLEGDALSARLNTYHRLTAAFEQENGYACESEITGVLKGLGLHGGHGEGHGDGRGDPDRAAQFQRALL